MNYFEKYHQRLRRALTHKFKCFRINIQINLKKSEIVHRLYIHKASLRVDMYVCIHLNYKKIDNIKFILYSYHIYTICRQVWSYSKESVKTDMRDIKCILKLKHLNMCPPVEKPYHLQPQELCKMSIDLPVYMFWPRAYEDKEESLKNTTGKIINKTWSCLSFSITKHDLYTGSSLQDTLTFTNNIINHSKLG